jgi:uncharacterized alkaline shock family protein YloU
MRQFNKSSFLLGALICASAVTAHAGLIEVLDSDLKPVKDNVVECRYQESNKYRIRAIVAGSDAKTRVRIIIDDVYYDMRRSGSLENCYEYDCEVPANSNFVRFCIQAPFDYHSFKDKESKPYTSASYRLHVVSHAVYGLEFNRGSPGCWAIITGRSFLRTDKVFVGDAEAETKLLTPHVLAFLVPSLVPGKAYPLKLVKGNYEASIGKFQVDTARTPVNQEQIARDLGGKYPIMPKIDFSGSKGDLLISIKTGITDSVILGDIKFNPEVIESVVRLAALEVKSVRTVIGTEIMGRVKEIFSRNTGIKIAEDENGNYIISVRVVIFYSEDIVKVALQIQKNICMQVKRMTRKDVAQVDIILDDVVLRDKLPEDAAEHEESMK